MPTLDTAKPENGLLLIYEGRNHGKSVTSQTCTQSSYRWTEMADIAAEQSHCLESQV